MSKYFKNFMLCGEIDFYCLLCKESFTVEEEVEKHIRWEKHRKLIKAQVYLPKFTKDAVYKVENNYYCEFCNLILPNMTSLKKHTKSEAHQAKKIQPEVDKNNNSKPVVQRKPLLGLIKVYNIMLTKKEWHGVINNNCIFCNTKVEDYHKHIELPEHLIKMINSEVKQAKEDENRIYRKINEDLLFCFECNSTLPPELLESHWTTGMHKDISGEDARTKQLFEIDFDNCLATCTLCKKTVDYTWNYVDEHRKEHIKNKEWEDNLKESDEAFRIFAYQNKGKMRENLKNLGKDNFIKLNEGGSRGYCSLCHTHISAHLMNFKQHINGTRHQSFLEAKGLIKKTKRTEKPRLKIQPFTSIANDIVHWKDSRYFLLTHTELCIDMMSLIMVKAIVISKKMQKFICFLCNVIFDDVKAHVRIDHTRKMFTVNVIIKMGEFIREIHPSIYHCGACNQIYAGWPVMEHHLTQMNHKMALLESMKTVQEISESCEEFQTWNPEDTYAVD